MIVNVYYTEEDSIVIEYYEISISYISCKCFWDALNRDIIYKNPLKIWIYNKMCSPMSEMVISEHTIEKTETTTQREKWKG